METFKNHEKFKLIVLAWSALFELQNSDARSVALRNLRSHLAEGGLLVIDCSVYAIEAAIGWGAPVPDGTPRLIGEHDLADGTHLKCSLARTFDPSTRDLELRVLIDEVGDARQAHSEFQWQLTYASPEEVQSELAAAGFSNLTTFGSYDRRPIYDPDLAGTGRQIHLARR
jgi:hypothetical protein